MVYKKRSVRKPKAVTCGMCGRIIPKNGLTRKFNGIIYDFDSDSCLLIFKKLRAVYGKHFFAPTEQC